MVGQTLGNYKITQKIGAGGQGAVYKATDNKLGRTVVVKVLPAELTVKETNLKRFEREARLASTLDHPNICTIFDLDEANGVHFIAMQYVEGRNVRQLVNGRPLEMTSALLIAIQVADALAAAHRSEEHTSELQSQSNLVCRLLLEKKKKKKKRHIFKQIKTKAK